MSNTKGPDKPVVLLVLDGWGYREAIDGNAIALADTPHWDRLWNRCSRTLLEASGRAVGLPVGQMGNSEVGHLNIGAGRTVPQDIVRIDDAITDGTFWEIPVLVELCQKVRTRGATLHLMGLLGDGGVHAIDRHLEAAIRLGERHGVPRIAVHAFTDGRDTAPHSGMDFMRKLVQFTETVDVPASIATVVGRYYAMDRDRRWPRIQSAYDAMVHGIGTNCSDPVEAIHAAYDAGETDEFITPRVVHGTPRIESGDGIFCFNFRADRMRQMVQALTLDDFDGFAAGPRPDVDLVTMTMYAETFDVPHAFGPNVFAKIMAAVVSERGMSQLRVAETEKYAHVTYFFNGGFEVPYTGEERLLVPSPQVATYDLQPEMSAAGVTETLCKAIRRKEHEFVLCNYANGDMVGHTGVMEAAVAAVETIDGALGQICRAVDEAGCVLAVTADHGNCEVMIDPANGGPHTAHTSNPVPFLLYGEGGRQTLRAGGALGDIAPTLLHLLGVDPPPEMTGRDLREGC